MACRELFSCLPRSTASDTAAGAKATVSEAKPTSPGCQALRCTPATLRVCVWVLGAGRRWGRGEKSGWQLFWVTARLSNIPRVNQAFFFFFFSWSPVLLRCEGSSSVLADTPAQTKAFLSFIYRALMRFLSVFPPSLLPHPPVPLCSLFAVRCGGCAEAISPAELVMRAGAAVFHLRCFTCSVCSCRLQTGDRCVLREGQLLCAREDYHQCLASPTSSDTGTGCSGQCVLCPITYGLFCLFQMIKAV